MSALPSDLLLLKCKMWIVRLTDRCAPQPPTSPSLQFGAIIGSENFFYKDPLIASGPCPDCNAESRIFFGSVLGVEGYADQAEFKCDVCKSKLTVSRDTLRVSSEPKFDLPKKV